MDLSISKTGFAVSVEMFKVQPESDRKGIKEQLADFSDVEVELLIALIGVVLDEAQGESRRRRPHFRGRRVYQPIMDEVD